MAPVVASVALGLAVLLNLVATVTLTCSEFQTPLQKVLQVVFIWAVPFVGSIIVIAVLKGTHSDLKTPFESGSSGDVWLPGIGPESEGVGRHHGGHGEGGGDAGFASH